MNKKIKISLPEELILELIKEAENHRETFEDLILRKLKYNDLSFREPDDFFQKKIIKISIDELTSESMKQEEFDKLLNEVLEDYFSKTLEERNKIAEETLKVIREAKQKKEEKSGSINEEVESELKIPKSIWDEIFDEIFVKTKTTEEIFEESANEIPILLEDEVEALNKTLNKRDERKLFIPQLRYDKEAYPIIRKILRKHFDKGESVKKKILSELRWLKVKAAERSSNEK